MWNAAVRPDRSASGVQAVMSAGLRLLPVRARRRQEMPVCREQPAPSALDGEVMTEAVQDQVHRTALLAAADFHGELLDRIFARVLKGGQAARAERQRGPGRRRVPVTSGYRYAGRLTWTGRRLLRGRLERLFGEAAFPVRRGRPRTATFYADTGLRSAAGEGPRACISGGATSCRRP